MSNKSDSSSTVASALKAPGEVVQEYPLSTALVVFGVGLGLGVLLSHTVCDSLLQVAGPKPTMTEKLSRQLYDVLSQAIPESVSRRFAA